jgi:hypothetical protein
LRLPSRDTEAAVAGRLLAERRPAELRPFAASDARPGCVTAGIHTMGVDVARVELLVAMPLRSQADLDPLV